LGQVFFPPAVPEMLLASMTDACLSLLQHNLMLIQTSATLLVYSLGAKKQMKPIKGRAALGLK
jgi:hypothetical protein